MDDKKVETSGFYRPSKIFDLVKDLNEYTKGIGTVAMLIKYQATPGNMQIHEDFLKYAFEEANNEYMVAIGKLLQLTKLGARIDALEQRLNILEVLTLDHVEACKKEEVGESSDVVSKTADKTIKTF